MLLVMPKPLKRCSAFTIFSATTPAPCKVQTFSLLSLDSVSISRTFSRESPCHLMSFPPIHQKSRMHFTIVSSSANIVLLNLGNPNLYEDKILSLADEIRNQGATKIGLYGLCWGSKPAGRFCELIKFLLLAKTRLSLHWS